MAGTVGDLVVLDDAVVANAAPLASPRASAIRLGVPRAYLYRDLDAELAVVVEHALEKLSAAQVQLVEADVPGIETLVEGSSFQIAAYEIARDLRAYLEAFSAPSDFEDLTARIASPDVQGLMAWVCGEDAMSERDYASGLVARQQLRKNFDDHFAGQRLDAIIFPTTQLPARPIAGSDESVELNGVRVPTFATYVRNTTPGSIAALPGISLPAGLTAAGLPVGMEIDGPERSDRQLLAVAKILEAIFGFRGQGIEHPPQ